VNVPKRFPKKASIIIAVLPLCLLSSCSPSSSSRFLHPEDRGDPDTDRGQPREASLQVELAAAEARMYRRRHEAPGHLVAGERIVVSAPFSAEVRELSLRPGDTVQENGIVARLETAELEEELNRLERRRRTKSREAAQQRYAVLDAAEEAERVWNSARRSAIRMREARTALGEAREELTSRRELFEAGGISRSKLQQSRKRVEQREFELRRLELLFEEKCIGLRDSGESAGVRQVHDLSREKQDYRFVENEEMRRAYVRRSIERHRGLIRIAEAKRDEVEAACETLRGRIARAAVRSPVSGIVLGLHAQRGEYVQRGAPLYSLYDPHELCVELFLGESAVSGIARGNAGSFRIPPDGRDIPAEVLSVSPEIDPHSKSFRIRLRLPSTLRSPEAYRRYKPGMFVETRVYSSQNRAVIEVPKTALFSFFDGSIPSDGESAEIFSYHPLDDGRGRVRRELVRLFRITESSALISSGIEPGSLVCADPPAGLETGAVVRGVLP